MSEILCVRCGLKREEIDELPYGGKIGKELQEKVCNTCWKEWYEQSIKLINEYRLSLREAKSREFLATQMKIFLKLMPPPKEGMAPINEIPPPYRG